MENSCGRVLPKHWFILAALLLYLSGCTAQDHARDVAAASEAGTNVTAGTVQREVRVGMGGGDVAEVLGAPNIVSTDSLGREVWIYDRISTTTIVSKSSGGVLGLGFGGGTVFGGGAGGYGGSAGVKATNQKTFTVVIKYDHDGLVRDFAYHTSSF